ncbi:hypothetical protein [Hymenobacter nivis]|uniref:RDD domain-containing protein n=1 Tax=Hymenobacter nivis TaxID=1850093 RepID=A0A502G9L5_9BACT|nr:hypothetical protein [Hymenobacter nivis]TPG58010.1 hypothetical protein EAH73_22720 [Hymenobacter nivis]
MAALISRKIRLLAMGGDHVIMCVLCVPIAFVLSPMVSKWAFYVLLVPYLNKDFLQGRSPAKRLLGLQLQEANGASANELRAFLRNVTVMVWPLEVLLVVAGGQKRLGDYLAGTQVVASASTLATTTRLWWQDLAAYRVTRNTLYTVLATLVYLLLLHGFFSWIGL